MSTAPVATWRSGPLRSADMQLEKLAQRYLSALQAGDAAAVLTLFAPDAMVSSPLYGTLPAATFYARLFDDTQASRTRLRTVLRGPDGAQGGGVAALYFEYDWELGGELTHFDVVDVLELGPDGLIQALTIIYDTARTREVYERTAQRP